MSLGPWQQHGVYSYSSALPVNQLLKPNWHLKCSLTTTVILCKVTKVISGTEQLRSSEIAMYEYE